MISKCDISLVNLVILLHSSHRVVGNHEVMATVTHLVSSDDPSENEDTEGETLVSRCYIIPFSISDTNECLLPPSHPWAHACHPSASCRNTVGAYECVCEENTLSTSFSSCPHSSTSSCCQSLPSPSGLTPTPHQT